MSLSLCISHSFNIFIYTHRKFKQFCFFIFIKTHSRACFIYPPTNPGKVTVLSSIQEEVRRLSIAAHSGPLQIHAPTRNLSFTSSTALKHRRKNSDASNMAALTSHKPPKLKQHKMSSSFQQEVPVNDLSKRNSEVKDVSSVV